ncbi:EamA family transporter [Corynebacterium aquilae]|uniref:EamA family transporter n=1 Tax=Corynebacterium aquilae TaxID=203263 RepID=UPI000950BAD8|nr:EamA family transporter [Corynebacterium aquilae]
MVRSRLAAPALMVASATSLYSGAAVAIGLFASLSPLVVAWLRIFVAGVILLIVFRPKKENFTGRAGRIAVVFGLAMVTMNMTFYEAIDRIPMGTAVAIEFLGPAVVAALGSRTVRDWMILVATVTGVVIVSGAQWAGSPIGVLFALGSAAGWALYIIAGVKIAGAGLSQQSLGIAFVYAALITSPIMIYYWPGWTVSPGKLGGLIVALAFLSTVVPTLCDQYAMRLAGRDVFSVLSALYPVTAAVLGVVVLGQSLSLWEMFGIALVVIAVASRRSSSPAEISTKPQLAPQADPADWDAAEAIADVQQPQATIAMAATAMGTVTATDVPELFDGDDSPHPQP